VMLKTMRCGRVSGTPTSDSPNLRVAGSGVKWDDLRGD
jgi:hypothetical protein